MRKISIIQLVYNAALKIKYVGYVTLIDPALTDKGTLISAFGVNKAPKVHLIIPIQDTTGDVDMVFLTHSHIDHYEPSIPMHLSKEIPFYVRPQDADAVRDDGSTDVISIEGIKIIDSMPIYHTTGHHGFGQIGQMMEPVLGYVLEAEGLPTVYIMGDCQQEAYIRDTVERFNSDYIVTSFGGAISPEFSKADSPIILDGNKVMQILDELPSRIELIVIYMNVIDRCQTTRAILRNKATHHETDMGRLIVSEDGETAVL